jgi:mRNA interferase HigB
VRVIARKTLREFWEKPGHDDAERPLKSWFDEAAAADWATPAQVKAQFGNASIVGNDRVVFNIAGNRYRLVVAVHYRTRCLFICFIGTHAQYDRIDVTTV